MANRHIARSLVLQTLYEWDFSGMPANVDIGQAIQRNADEFAPGVSQHSFMEILMKNILAKRPELDMIIEKAAPEWPIDKISMIDRNILRLGLYELLFADRKEVPAKVAINEAIELAKSFGSDASSKFVNGVLGAVYKEIGEPGKEEVSKKKVDIKNLPIERLGGAVVYARDGQDVFLALVHDVFGHWTLAKGHIEEGEELEVGTVRNMKEELGLKVKIIDKIGENEYIATHPEKGKLKKHVVYFLAEASFGEITLEEKGGLDDAKWFKLQDILELNFYEDILPIVTKAISIISEKKTS